MTKYPQHMLTPIAAVTHAERAHALLSPSSSDRWLACPPSARLNDGAPDEPSEASLTGTLGHELTELQLRHYLEYDPSMDQIGGPGHHLKSNQYYSIALEEAVQKCCKYGYERCMAARAQYGKDSVIVLIERRVNLAKWVPESFGSADLVIITPDYVEVIDWKFGSWPVEIKGNSQLRLYGIGVAEAYSVTHDFKKVIMTIMQPFVQDEPQTDEMELDDLYRWVRFDVAPKAADAFLGIGNFNPGEKQCKFCAARGSCRARAEAQLEMANQQFDGGGWSALPGYALLSDKEMAELYPKLDELVRWASDVREMVTAKVMGGATLPGLKAVAGKTYRVITDPEGAVNKLLAHGYTEEDILQALPKQRDILGVTKLEEVIGKKKFKELLDPYVSKPPGAPIVVHVSDPRDAIPVGRTTAEEDFA